MAEHSRFWLWMLGFALLLACAPAAVVLLRDNPAEVRFAQLREGMTREEVLAIMGPARSSNSEITAWSDGKRMFIAVFEEDILMAKNAQEMPVNERAGEGKRP
jgi:hypothetical protein